MNKKDLAELKKVMINDCGYFTINKVMTAVINQKSVVYSDVKSFFNFPEDEGNEIISNLRKTITGKVGKIVTEYEFPNVSDTQNFLLKVIDSRLEDEDVNNEFLDKIRDSVSYDGAYTAIIGHCTYSVYDKKSDESDDFNFIISAICPIKLRIDGLIFNDAEQVIEKKKISDRIIDKPTDGFMFPSFTDRMADVNHVIYYSKSSSSPNVSIIEELLGCEYIMSAELQATTFKAMVSKLAEKEMDYQMIAKINEQISDLVDSSVAMSEPREIDCTDMIRILSEAGLSDEKLNKIQDLYLNVMGKKTFIASNLCENKISIKANNLNINVNYKNADTIKPQVINGKRCIMIDLDEPGIEVNGISTYIE